jgi:hypothetical protein
VFSSGFHGFSIKGVGCTTGISLRDRHGDWRDNFKSSHTCTFARRLRQTLWRQCALPGNAGYLIANTNKI